MSFTVTLYLCYLKRLSYLQMVDGKNVKTMNINWLRSKMGIVSQEPVLFDGTITENIAYGDMSRDVPIFEVIAAARMANIHTFIDKLPRVSS